MPFTRIHASFVLAIGMSLWGSILIIIGATDDHWFETTTTEFAHRIGLTNVCTTTVCEPHNYTADMDLSVCTQTGSQMAFRMRTVRGALFGGVSAALLSSIVTTLSVCLRITKLLYLGQFILTIGFGVSCLGMVFFYASMEEWLWCDKPFCAWYAEVVGSGRPCYYYYGFSFSLAAGGVVLYLLSTLWCGFTVVAAAKAQNDDDDDDDESDDDGEDAKKEKKGKQSGSSTDRRETTTVVEEDVSQQQPHSIPYGYIYDADSGYYYNDSTNWYFDADSGQYYDAQSDTWF